MSITPFIPPACLTDLPAGIWSGAGGLPVLPYLPGQEVSVSKAPRWSTQVIRAASGRERRTAYWNDPLWQFELSYGVVRHRPAQAELVAMWEFFNALQGQFAPFLFVDPTDCQVPTSVLIDASGAPILDTGGAPVLDGSGAPIGATFGVGDGATTSFQLARKMNSFAEPVYAVFQPLIFVGGAWIASGFTLDGGQITFATPPAVGAALQWTGYFYFGCRFLQDDLTFEQIVTQLWSGKSLKFTSLRV
jgi:uncharacterized protein (TIGR02217 family)